jgi:GTPase Era involved in 16S rRNA processing
MVDLKIYNIVKIREDRLPRGKKDTIIKVFRKDKKKLKRDEIKAILEELKKKDKHDDTKFLIRARHSARITTLKGFDQEYILDADEYYDDDINKDKFDRFFYAEFTVRK